MAIILEMQDIVKEFPGVKALKGVSLTLNEGEVLSIVGENGAGKSTLIKVLCGVHKPDSGHVLLDGKVVSFSRPTDAIQSRISTIHQELSYIKDLSVAENMYVGRLPYKGLIKHIDWKKLYEQAEPFLKEVGVTCKPTDLMRGLSVENKQLVEIAKALSRDARVIIMDEPTSSLGIEETATLLKLIKTLARRGIGIIYISHRLSEVVEVSDRVICMRDGEKITELVGEDITVENMVTNMVGRKLTEMYPAFDYSTDRVMFEVKDICTDYLKNVSFKAHAGEVLGLFGMAGAGRTETFDAVYGASPMASGQVFVDGQEVNIRTPADAMSNGIAYVTAERKQNGLILVHSVENNVALASLNELTNAGILDHKRSRGITMNWIHSLGIKTPGPATEVGSLSGGNQQKVVLAKWLERKPKVIFLNEPTRGVDVGAKKEIYSVIEELCKQGLCVILSASEMSEIMNIADRIVTFAEGKVTKEIAREDFSQENLMRASVPGGN